MRQDDSNPFNNPIVKLAIVVVAIIAFGGGYLVARKGLPAGVNIPGLPGGSPGGGSTADNISFYFSPKGGCTDAIVTELGTARQSVLVQAYSFTSKPISEALVAAYGRGVKVTVILDKSDTTEKTEGETVLAAGIPTYVDARHAIAHNKIMIIDGRTVITGSFNFTYQAEHNNAENLIILRDRTAMADAYTRNFNEHLGHSTQADAGTFSGSKNRTNTGRFDKAR